jgi:hypothetical protein
MTLEQAFGLGQTMGFWLGFLLGVVMTYLLTRLYFDSSWH